MTDNPNNDEKKPTIDERLEALSITVENMSGLMGDILKSQDRQDEQIAALTVRMDGLTGRVDTLTEKVGSLTESVSQLVSVVRELSTQADSDRRIMREMVQDLKESIRLESDRTHRRIDNLEGRVEKLESGAAD